LKIFAAKSANLGAHEPSVILDADLAATEKVSHGGYRLLCAFSARTNGEDEITE
jgi:hypothetical protein